MELSSRGVWQDGTQLWRRIREAVLSSKVPLSEAARDGLTLLAADPLGPPPAAPPDEAEPLPASPLRVRLRPSARLFGVGSWGGVVALLVLSNLVRRFGVGGSDAVVPLLIGAAFTFGLPYRLLGRHATLTPDGVLHVDGLLGRRVVALTTVRAVRLEPDAPALSAGPPVGTRWQEVRLVLSDDAGRSAALDLANHLGPARVLFPRILTAAQRAGARLEGHAGAELRFLAGAPERAR